MNEISLGDLVDFNSKADLKGSDAVMCGQCCMKTPHSSKRDYNPDIFLIEIIRVTESKVGWVKNNARITFPVTSLTLPGFSRSYRVAATCNHNRTLKGGHWLSKVHTTGGWYALDDLKSTSLLSTPPGIKDNSVVVILLLVISLRHVQRLGFCQRPGDKPLWS